MRVLKTTILSALFLLSLTGCGKWLQDEELTLAKQPYNGNELKLNGYYYYLHNGFVFHTYFFYKNGVCLYGNSFYQDDMFEGMNQVFLSDNFLHNLHKHNYGVFQIINDSIVFEKWAIGEGPKPVTRYLGTILNDTTFIINQHKSPHSGEVYQSNNEVFHFHAFSPKPDSTNRYIQ